MTSASGEGVGESFLIPPQNGRRRERGSLKAGDKGLER